MSERTFHITKYARARKIVSQPKRWICRHRDLDADLQYCQLEIPGESPSTEQALMLFEEKKNLLVSGRVYRHEHRKYKNQKRWASRSLCGYANAYSKRNVDWKAKFAGKLIIIAKLWVHFLNWEGEKLWRYSVRKKVCILEFSQLDQQNSQIECLQQNNVDLHNFAVNTAIC